MSLHIVCIIFLEVDIVKICESIAIYCVYRIGSVQNNNILCYVASNTAANDP